MTVIKMALEVLADVVQAEETFGVMVEIYDTKCRLFNF